MKIMDPCWLNVPTLIVQRLAAYQRSSSSRRKRSCGSYDQFIEMLEVRTLLSAGTLDPTFGDGGKILTDVLQPSQDGGANSAIYQPDGKPIVVGPGPSGNMVALRYNLDGSRDATFGDGGVAQVNFRYSSRARTAAIDSQGRILLGGETSVGGQGLDVAVARLTSEGQLDESFGDSGLRVINFGSREDRGMSIAIDSLDRVVIAGYSDQSTGTYSDFDFAVARLTSDGNPDPDFSGDGKQIINMGSISDYGRSVAIDAADRVVVVGGNSEFSVVRLTTAGELDPSFDLDGRSSLKYQNRTNTAQSVAIDDEGRIYIGGFANLGTTGYDFVVARMTSDGYGDGTFGDEGFQSLDFHSSVDFLTSLSLDTQGRVLLAGRSTQGSTENDFVVSRLTTAGIVDTTFGDGGKQLIDFDSSRDFTDSVTTNSQDQVLLSGWTTQPETLNDWALVQLTSEGQFDETFGQSGIVLTDIGVGGGNDRDAAVTASQSDGKVLVVGQTTFGPAVLRYNSDGSIDTTFGEDGKKILDLRSGSTPVNITTDHDDRILVSGTPARSLDFGVIRLTPDGDIDSTFGTSGTATVDFGTNSEQVKSVFVDAENRILLSGYAYTPTGNLDFAVARLTSDGAPDPNFDSDGKQTIDFGGTSDRAYAVQTDSQGRIVVSGYLLDSAVRDFAAARLNSDGSLDEMFNGTGTQIVDFYGRRDYGYDVAIDSQDRVVIAGTSHDPSTGYYSFAVSRLTDTGGFDSDFSGDGRELLNFGSAYDQATSVEVGSGDRILLGGYSNDWNSDFTVALLEADGSLDATFADSGVLFIDFGSSNERGQSVAIDLEGRVLIAGYSYQGSNRRYDFALARINAELNNSAPIANDSTLDIAENSPDGTVVGSVDASDPDNDSLTFSIASGNELGAFAIDSATGQITVAETRLLDYESVAQFSLDVLVTDRQGGTATATVTVNVLNQASITGQVFIDIDQNGILDGNDTGIEGVAVELTDPSGAIVAVTTTNSEGKYTFEDLDPGTYLINELQPTGVDDGPEVLGNLGGTIVPDDQIELSLQRVDATDYLFAEYGRETVRAETADVSFWISRNGQELIAAGGSSLANWLTETFSNVFGDQLANGSGEDVAVFIKQLNRGRAGKVDAEFMALALSTYFSSSRISGSTIAAEYGFTVTDTGIGAGLANVGSSGAAFGVADGTDLTIMQLLSATNALTDRTDQEGGFAAIYDEDGNGSINAGEDLMRRLAKNLYASINNGSVVPRRAEKIH